MHHGFSDDLFLRGCFPLQFAVKKCCDLKTLCAGAYRSADRGNHAGKGKIALGHHG
jgi:hypothetical protein